MLKERYLQYLLEVDPDVHNENYKADKLKDKLKNFFGSKIQFWRPSSKEELVYSDDITKGQAIGVVFELASSDEQRVVEAAMILRRHIIEEEKQINIFLIHQQQVGFCQTKGSHLIF